MTTTTQVTLTASAWTRLANGSAKVLVQRVQAERVEIVVAQADPDDAHDIGHELSEEAPSVSFVDLEEADQVWGRAFYNNCDVAVTKSAEPA